VYIRRVRLAGVFVGVALLAGIAHAQANDAKAGQGDVAEVQRRAAAEQACGQHDPHCDWLATFSSLERQSLTRALEARGFQIEPAPWGKTIAKIYIFTENVFAEDNWLQFFNFIHYTTVDRAIRDELTVREGELWNDDTVAESARRLHDPLYSSVVALVPVRIDEPGKVGLLVVTRDVWSLRFNSQYTFQEGSLTNLSISISENNFLGNRDVLSAALLMDQGSIAVGPLFIDKNVLGTHLSLSARVDQQFTRQSLDVFDPSNEKIRAPSGDPRGIEDGHSYRTEGSDSSISLQYPLWSLASEWGAGASFSHFFGISRSFAYTGLAGYDDPATPMKELVPTEYQLRRWSVNASVVRQWGTWLKHRLSLGETITSNRPSLMPNFPTDPMLRADFIRDVFPRSEQLSTPYVEYYMFMPRYRTLRNVATYELAEDAQIGPSVDAVIGEGVRFLGSDAHFFQPQLSVGWTLLWWRDGFISPSAGIQFRIQDGISHGTPVSSIDDSASAQLRIASPGFQYFRLLAQAGVSTRWNDTQNTRLAIGSSNGLRGYAINQFVTSFGSSGQRLFSGLLEARSAPFPLWVLRVGGVAFYEVGGAADSLTRMPLYQDIGVGVRALVPQTSRDLFRFDLAFPMIAAPGWPAWHPQFIAGFGSYF
jgi:hypothetical protein